MSFLSDAIKIADDVTRGLGLQAVVTHRPWLSQTAQGKATYGGAVEMPAAVTLKQTKIRTQSGQEVMSRATITFPRDVAISVKDHITLPDGSSGPILSIDAPIDPETGRGFATTVYI